MLEITVRVQVKIGLEEISGVGWWHSLEKSRPERRV